MSRSTCTRTRQRMGIEGPKDGPSQLCSVLGRSGLNQSTETLRKKGAGLTHTLPNRAGSARRCCPNLELFILQTKAFRGDRPLHVPSGLREEHKVFCICCVGDARGGANLVAGCSPMGVRNQGRYANAIGAGPPICDHLPNCNIQDHIPQAWASASTMIAAQSHAKMHKRPPRLPGVGGVAHPDGLSENRSPTRVKPHPTPAWATLLPQRGSGRRCVCETTGVLVPL